MRVDQEEFDRQLAACIKALHRLGSEAAAASRAELIRVIQRSEEFRLFS